MPRPPSPTSCRPARASRPPIDRRGAVRLPPSTSGGPAESYTLTVGRAIRVRRRAPTTQGCSTARRRCASSSSSDGDGWVDRPRCRSRTRPRFAYRGVMLDVARHFFPVETVKAYIDRAAALKLNALHLHLSDDQGWRLHTRLAPACSPRSPPAPRSAATPAASSRKADYREIVDVRRVPPHDRRARDRHARPHPRGRPRLPRAGRGPGAHRRAPRDRARLRRRAPDRRASPTTGWRVGFSSLKIHDEATYDFVADVFGELAAMTPGPYLHVGGDEALGTAPEDFAEFVTRATALVANLGKIPIAWHEAGAAARHRRPTRSASTGASPPRRTGTDDRCARVRAAAARRLILSPADAAYLDMKYDAVTPLWG